MTFDLCVPAYNEAKIIKESLMQICGALAGTKDAEWNVIVADNASSDGTGDIVRLFPDPRVSWMRVEKKGKGIAIIEAARRSTSDFFGFIDADLSANPYDIIPMLTAVSNDEADIVVGSRLLDTQFVQRSILRSASSTLFNWFRRAFLGVNVVDSQCGLKVMNARAREILRSCMEIGWFLDIEFLAKAERAGLRIREVPVHWNEQQFKGRVSKLRILRDGFGALGAMARIRRHLG